VHLIDNAQSCNLRVIELFLISIRDYWRSEVAIGMAQTDSAKTAPRPLSVGDAAAEWVQLL
jgi:hypothetical protein